MRKFGCIGLILLPLLACQKEQKDLPSYEDRVEAARADFIEKLTEPASGWRLDYSPVSGSGTYLVLLEFDENGTVRIQSDVSADDGYYYDQTISYRVDNASHLELILETYSVFHYLFELDQASFGAEFEFLYDGEEDTGLVFESKSDIGTPSELRFIVATPNTASLFSRAEALNMQKFAATGPRNDLGLPVIPPMQQAYFLDKDLSIYWSIDQAKRVISINKVISGRELDGEVITDDSLTTGYTYEDGAIRLATPISFTFDQMYSISSLELGSFSESGGEPFCIGDTSKFPVYSGSVAQLGAFELTNSLYSVTGESFVSGENAVYSVNIPFIFDAEINSLADEGGIIYELLPEAVGFIFFFGVSSDTYPAYSIGFIVEDENEETQYYLQEFEPTSLVGNRLELTFRDSFYLSGTPPTGTQDEVTTVLGTIFEGGTVYVYLTPYFGLNLFRVYNPCNKYEILLVG